MIRSGRLPSPAWIAALLHVAALLVALTVALAPGGSAAIRQLLALDLYPPSGTWVAAARIFVHNLLVLSPLLAGPWVVARLGHGRCLLLSYAAWHAGWAVLTVGAAVGAYGPSLLPRLLHVPLEWVALAVSLAGLRSGQGARPAAATCMCATLLMIGAIIEVGA